LLVVDKSQQIKLKMLCSSKNLAVSGNTAAFEKCNTALGNRLKTNISARANCEAPIYE